MKRVAKLTMTLALVVAATLPMGCERRTKNEQFVLDQALDLVERENGGRGKTTIEVASLNKELNSICGYATIGDRKHLPYYIKYSNALPKGGFATVDLVMDRPRFKGELPESQEVQAARILAACKQAGHQLPPP